MGLIQEVVSLAIPCDAFHGYTTQSPSRPLMVRLQKLVAIQATTRAPKGQRVNPNLPAAEDLLWKVLEQLRCISPSAVVMPTTNDLIAAASTWGQPKHGLSHDRPNKPCKCSSMTVYLVGTSRPSL